MNEWNRLCPGCFQTEKTESRCSVCGYHSLDERSQIELEPYTVIRDQYVIGRVLGKPGGFGITYLGWDKKLEMRVALKEFLPRELAARDTNGVDVRAHSKDDQVKFKYGLDRFLLEAQTLAQIDNPNVVRVRHFLEANGTAYLVMNYIEGMTLNEYVRQSGGRLAESVALALLHPLLDGLDEVHRQGFLHRDIKPNNVYISNSGNPILLDFGAARSAVREQSRGMSVVLSPGYAPYEQYFRSGLQGTWTDVYGCAATLYFMLTGSQPPEATGRRLDEESGEMDQALADVSANLREAVKTGLSVHPEDRPATVDEFRSLLEGNRAGFDSARTIRKSPSTRQFEHDASDGSSPFGQTVAVAGPVVSPPFSRRSSGPLVAGSRREGKAQRSSLFVILVGLILTVVSVGVWYVWTSGVPDVITVSRSGSADYQTITEAITRAGEGTTIQIEPGSYRETLIIPKSVELNGLTERGAVVIESEDPVVMTLSAPMVRLRGIEVRGLSQNAEAIRIVGGEARLAGVTATSEAGMGIQISGSETTATLDSVRAVGSGTDGIRTSEGATVRINQSVAAENGGWGLVTLGPGRTDVDKSAFFDNGTGGIRVEGASPTFTAIDVYENEKPGLFVTAAGNPSVRNSDFRDGKQNGIFINQGSSGTYDNVRVFGNVFAGIAVLDSSQPVIENSRIFAGKDVGIWVYEGGKPTIRDSEVSENDKHGIVLGSRSDVFIQRVKIHDGKQNGLLFQDGAAGRVEDSEVFNNALAGVGIKNEADPLIVRTKIYNGKETGLWVYENGKGRIEQSDIYANTFQNVNITTGGNPAIRETTIRDGQSAGVWVVDRGLGTFESCRIYGNATAGVGVSEGGDPELTNNDIYENQSHGVWINSRGRGTISNNRIYRNARHGVMIETQTFPVFTEDNMVENNGDTNINDLSY